AGGGPPFERPPLGSVADQRQVGVGHVPHHRGPRRQQEVLALLPREATDADDEALFAETEPGPRLRTRAGAKTVEVHGRRKHPPVGPYPEAVAEATLVLAGADDEIGPPGTDSLPRHNGGPQHAVDREERPPVGLEDRGPTAPEQQAAGQTGFGRMQVDDVGSDASNDPPQAGHFGGHARPRFPPRRPRDV